MTAHPARPITSRVPAELGRRRRLLERHWPWMLAFFSASASLLAFTIALDRGVFDDYEAFPALVRGYAVAGVLLGLLSVALSLASFTYAFRKRALQEVRFPGRSTLAAWLWGHVYLGSFAVVVAIAHAGYGMFNLTLSSGKALLLVLLTLFGSGLLWRLLYRLVPGWAAREVGNYSSAASHARAEACRVEIDKIAAGRSPRFRELTDFAVAHPVSQPDAARAALGLSPDEQPAFAEVATLASARHEALGREKKQQRALVLLQGLRVLHVPLGLLFFVLLPLHVVLAYDLPARALDRSFQGSALGGFEPSSRCAECHTQIYEEWRHSMHAHAMTSPIMIAQTNQVAESVLATAADPDPKRVCVNCHGPVGARLTNGNTLPLETGPLAQRELIDDGISCAVCHQWQGDSHTGGAGLSSFLDGLRPGRTYFGPFGNASGNAFHRSERGEVFLNPEKLCQNCHSVQYDKNGDGKLERGVDLVLQTLFDEWQLYAKAGGASCLDCHMPEAGTGRAADGASIPFEQDQDAPPRRHRDHSFVAVDYPLGQRSAREHSRPRREAILRSAATLGVAPPGATIAGDRARLAVTVTNSGTGHNLPGGFAFVRQMWLEVVIENAAGRVLAASGRLGGAGDDLCDASILDDPESPVRPFVKGCTASDPLLVNFQQMLVDRVEPARDSAGAVRLGARGENLLARVPGAREVVIQHLEAGPVPRLRKATNTPVAPLAPGETATLPYELRLPAGERPARVKVRLLFRVASPYFLRALAARQPPGETPRLDSLVSELEVTEMAALELRL